MTFCISHLPDRILSARPKYRPSKFHIECLICNRPRDCFWSLKTEWPSDWDTSPPRPQASSDTPGEHPGRNTIGEHGRNHLNDCLGIRGSSSPFGFNWTFFWRKSIMAWYSFIFENVLYSSDSYNNSELFRYLQPCKEAKIGKKRLFLVSRCELPRKPDVR